MPWWWALISPGSTSMPVAAELGDAGVRRPQRVALADRRDGAVADEHGAVAQRWGVGGGEQDVAVDEEGGLMPADASGRH